MTIHAIPQAQGHFILGNLPAFRRDPLATIAYVWKQNGDMVNLRMGYIPFTVVSSPDIVQDILINQKNDWGKVARLNPNKQVGLGMVLDRGLLTNPDEDDWLLQRRMMQPMFHRKRIADTGEKMVSAGQDMLQRWENLPPDQPFDLHSEMGKVTMDIITRTMFSADILTKAGNIGKVVEVAAEYVFKRVGNPFSLPRFVPSEANRQFDQALNDLDALVYGFINDRRASGEKKGDLLDMLLEARDEDTGAGMSDKQIRDEVATIFGAGHETTANTLTWVWWMLTQHPHVMAELQREVDTVLGGRTPTLEDMPKLSYTQMVFEETLRLYPAAPLMIRAAMQDTQLNGHPMKKGHRVVLAIANIHRHPTHWQNPDVFDPQNFAPAAKEGRHRMAFMAFGGGNHLCIGNHFAMMEGVLLLAMMAQRYELQHVATHRVEKQLAVTLRPKYGMLMTIKKRQPILAQ